MRMIAAVYCGVVGLQLLLFGFGGSNAVAAAVVYNVVDFGAKGDGKTDSTEAFGKAWSWACDSSEDVHVGVVWVPEGRFLIKPIVFSGPCKREVVFSMDGNGSLVAPSNYWGLGESGHWILFYKVVGLTVSGGTLDAKGASFWACRRSGGKCPPGARSISFVRCSEVVVSRLTSRNSHLFHISIDQSRNIRVEEVRIRAPSWSINTDGVHIQSSTQVSVTNSTIRTGDDCISIGPASTNLWIQAIACGPGHGISVGSLGEHSQEDGVQNVTVRDVVLRRTENGVRIKSWARPSTGFATQILFQNIIIINASNPIIIDQNYCPGPDRRHCPNQGSGVRISGVRYKNIKGTSASEIAMNFGCSPVSPCQGLQLQDIQLTYSYPNTSTVATSSCKHAIGSSSGLIVPSSCLLSL